MSESTPSPRRVVATTLSLVFGSILLLLALLGAIPAIEGNFSGNWNGTAGISTPRYPFIDSWSELSKSDDAQYSGVQISSDDPLVGPRILGAVSSGLSSLVAIVGTLLIVVLAARLLAQRSFSRLAKWGLVVLGVVIMTAAVVVPQLDALAVDVAVRELGYPLFDTATDLMMTPDSPEKVVLNLWDPIWILGRVDLTQFVLGAILPLLGMLVGDGLRLQRETEGLI